MKQIRGGVLYDTAEASVIYSSKYVVWHEIGATEGLETLYLTPNNRYFIFDQPGIVCIRSASIVPKSQEEAVLWLERVHAPEKAFRAIGVRVEAG